MLSLSKAIRLLRHNRRLGHLVRKQITTNVSRLRRHTIHSVSRWNHVNHQHCLRAQCVPWPLLHRSPACTTYRIPQRHTSSSTPTSSTTEHHLAESATDASSSSSSSEHKQYPYNRRSYSEEIYSYETQSSRADKTEDSQVIFELIFGEISAEQGGEPNMVFPKDIMWLCGAPGSGKGEMSQWIMYQRGYHAEPIKISEILTGTEIEAMKAQGKLVSDRIVLTILLQKLLLPEYRTGVIVDGFPRTKLQAEFIRLLFDKMLYLRRKFDGTPHFIKFRRPKFHITVLYVDQAVSVQRQLQRGLRYQELNERVRLTGIGAMIPIRETDVDEQKAIERYQYFQDHIYSAIEMTKTKFPFHFISAEAPIERVKERILKELEYQSSSELGDETFDMVRQISLASEIKLDARHKLVQRLDSYATEEHVDFFQQVINVFKYEFEPLVRQQALMGTCIISTENGVFSEKEGIGVTMMLDLLAERGYRVILDIIRVEKPVNIDMRTGDIKYELRRVFKWHIVFPQPKMRHAISTYETDVSLTQ